MKQIEGDVAALVPAPVRWSLLDGLLLGAVIGAAGAALVIISQLVATRRLVRRFGPASGGRRTPQIGGVESPL
jgi:hypothetical protein